MSEIENAGAGRFRPAENRKAFEPRRHFCHQVLSSAGEPVSPIPGVPTRIGSFSFRSPLFELIDDKVGKIMTSLGKNTENAQLFGRGAA